MKDVRAHRGERKLQRKSRQLYAVFLFAMFMFIYQPVMLSADPIHESYDGWAFLNGKELYRLCTSKEIADANACALYICGTIDGWGTEYILGKSKTYSICLPKDITCDGLAKIVSQDFDDHPDHQKSAAAAIVGYSLQQKFKCKQQ